MTKWAYDLQLVTGYSHTAAKSFTNLHLTVCSDRMQSKFRAINYSGMERRRHNLMSAGVENVST